MDAICFVVGLSARSLRGDKLLDLVFGNANEKRAKTASVTLHYITSADEVEGCDEGDEMLFTRSITSAGASVYKVNNKEVSFETYTEALASINLITKARNFLVFQVSSVSNGWSVCHSHASSQSVKCAGRCRECCVQGRQGADEALRNFFRKRRVTVSAVAVHMMACL